MKAAFVEAFEKRGGVKALLEWANENPTEFYKLCGRLIPHEVSGPDGEPIGNNSVLVMPPEVRVVYSRE